MDKFTVAKFDGTNFHLWKFQLRILLQGQDLWEVTDGTQEKPEASSSEATKKEWNVKNNKAMMYITQSLDIKQLSLLINCEKASEMWSKLTSIYEQKNTSSIHMIQQMFFDYKMDDADDMATHISKVENLARRLKDLGEEPSASSVITKILCSLPPSYRHIVSAWDATPRDQQTLSTLTARLLKEEEMDKQMGSTSTKDIKSDAYFVHGRRQQHTTGKETKKKGNCNYCKRPGHWFKECRKRKRDLEKPSGSAHVTQGVASGSVLIAHESNADWNQEWVADSGATHHMTPRREWFESMVEIPEGCFSVNIANKEKSQVMEKMQQFLLDWRLLSTSKVKRLRTDNGGEFTGKKLESWLLNKNIRHETSVPYVPQQNGFIERSNRTVVEATRSMLHSSGVPLSLWAEATHTAVHVLNLIPNKSLNYKTPIEQLTGTKGRIDHLRVFGSDVYVLKQEHQRKKLDAKSEKGILVGYSLNNNAYRVFMGGKEIVVAKDVVIRERGINETSLDQMRTEAVSAMKKQPRTPVKESTCDEFVVDVCLPLSVEDTTLWNQRTSSLVGAVQTDKGSARTLSLAFLISS